jgi:hypothetical protein
MEQQESKNPLPRCPHAKQWHLPVRWHHFDTFPVPVRHRCLKLPRSRFVRFLRQQVAR